MSPSLPHLHTFLRALKGLCVYVCVQTHCPSCQRLTGQGLCVQTHCPSCQGLRGQRFLPGLFRRPICSRSKESASRSTLRPNLVPGTRLSTSHVLIYSILTMTLQGRSGYYPHFTDRKQRRRKLGELPRSPLLVRDRQMRSQPAWLWSSRFH